MPASARFGDQTPGLASCSDDASGSQTSTCTTCNQAAQLPSSRRNSEELFAGFITSSCQNGVWLALDVFYS